MIYLYGAGGHAKVIAEIIETCGEQIGGFFDKDVSIKIRKYFTYSFPGPFDYLNDKLVISIGNNLLRKRIAESNSLNYYNAVHPRSIISDSVSLGEGTVVMGGAIINANANIGKHCIINSNSSVDHDCILQNFVHISPNATLSGDVLIGQCVHVGAGAVIIPGIKIGVNSIIGAGAVIIRDVPDNVVVAGNPGRIIKKSNEN